jgi:hypothetical protein
MVIFDVINFCIMLAYLIELINMPLQQMMKTPKCLTPTLFPLAISIHLLKMF